MKFNEGKCKILPLGRSNPVFQDSLGSDCIENNFGVVTWGSWWTKS